MRFKELLNFFKKAILVEGTSVYKDMKRKGAQSARRTESRLFSKSVVSKERVASDKVRELGDSDTWLIN
jgi:hypothetical protein